MDLWGLRLLCTLYGRRAQTLNPQEVQGMCSNEQRQPDLTRPLARHFRPACRRLTQCITTSSVSRSNQAAGTSRSNRISNAYCTNMFAILSSRNSTVAGRTGSEWPHNREAQGSADVRDQVFLYSSSVTGLPACTLDRPAKAPLTELKAPSPLLGTAIEGDTTNSQPPLDTSGSTGPRGTGTAGRAGVTGARSEELAERCAGWSESIGRGAARGSERGGRAATGYCAVA